ncbi:putative t-SNARE coiled-coil-like protein [Seiridium cardinale]|uniref:t-SNARE coiled-coil-like protein n=1 Tax=Seiridium cardinale TaxID=138064 RepID=A0ABR2XIX5_9PEZI
MGKFSFGSKKSAEGDDPNRSALFGGRKAPGSNPYAEQAPTDDPYMQSAPMTSAQASYRQYQQAPRPGGLPSGPRGGAPPTRNMSNASNETAGPPPPYSGASSGGYNSDRYGAPGGYGNSRYDSGGAEKKQRPGGYGGLGPANNDDDAARDNLFGGARERAEQRQQQPSAAGSSGTGDDSGYGGGYGARRELTAEEQEEEEVQDIRRQIKETKLASANSAENSERIANQAVETALGTYARLGAQHERLNYTENLLDKAGLSTRDAESSTKKLKSLNRSMFAVHVNNPFTAGKKTREMEQQILEQHRADRDLRESTRKAGWQANEHMEKGFKEIEATRSTDKWQRASAAEKSKYQFEDDESDDEAEDRIDAAMARTSNHVGTLNSVARLMQKEIDSQDRLIGRLGEKDAASDPEDPAMKPSLRLLAQAATTSTNAGLRPALALLPPIPLYRRLFRAHRKHLPAEMRLLGDEYIKAEFRAHRETENPVHILYAQKIEGDSWKGEKIDQSKIEKMSDQQMGQMYELMRAIRNRAQEDDGDE